MRHSLLLPFIAVVVFACSSDKSEPDGAAGSGGSGASGGSAGTAGMPGVAGMSSGAGTGGSAGTGTAGMPSAAGTGGSSGAASNGDFPPDLTIDGISALIDAESYKAAPWASDRTDVNTMPDEISPHGNHRIWYNKTLREAHAAAAKPLTTGSMVVKELYTGTDVVGHAALLRTSSAYFLYCESSEEGRCFSGSAANTPHAVTSGIGSCGCHGGGTIITEMNIPAP